MPVDFRAVDADGHVEESRVNRKGRVPEPYRDMAPGERQPLAADLGRALKIEDPELLSKICD
ncbi:MAG TPA: hypothetical protein VNO43_04450 [Candidatus Eisenbacteria bacterium]|nr:hypothetical protein [Candidatus Eisenbacteria bacterium]